VGHEDPAPASYSKMPSCSIFFTPEKSGPKSPETLDAVGVQPTASQLVKERLFSRSKDERFRAIGEENSAKSRNRRSIPTPNCQFFEIHGSNTFSPHSKQNFAWSGSSLPHLGQSMIRSSPLYYKVVRTLDYNVLSSYYQVFYIFFYNLTETPYSS